MQNFLNSFKEMPALLYFENLKVTYQEIQYKLNLTQANFLRDTA